MQGDAERALPEIERRLGEVRGWWRRHCTGEAIPEAPDAVLLGRVLVAGLDMAGEANLALRRWQACLDLLDEIEATKRSLGEGEHALAFTRFNRYFALLQLGRLDEAQRLLEGCLEVFRAAGDLTHEAGTVSALADLWDKRGDGRQAASLERQALAVCNRLPGLEDRSTSHGNLSNYLARLGEDPEAARHLLAAIVYDVVTRRGGGLTINVNNLAIRIRRAAATGQRYELPRLAELRARPDFAALRQALEERGADAAELQAAIDGHVEQVRGQVEADG